MKKRSIKLMALLLSGLMVASALMGCANGKDKEEDKQSTGTGETSDVYPENGLSKNEKITLKAALFEGGYGREYMDELAAAFKKKFPNVSLDITSSPKIGDLVNPKIMAGNDKEMFDIFDPSGIKIEDLILNGKIEPMNILDREPYDKKGKKLKDMIRETAYKGFSQDSNGNPYNIATDASMNGLFYNKAFFKQNGWNENPKTWAEFLKLCESIKAKGVAPLIAYGNYLTVLVDPKLPEMADMIEDKKFVENSWAYNVPYYSSNAAIGVMKKIAELGQKGYFDKGTGVVTHTESQMMIIQNKIALCPTGTYVENEMKGSAPEGFEWGYMLIPMRDNENQKLYGSFASNTGAFYIWKDKPELTKKWAKEFKLFMLSMEGQEILAKSGQVPVRIDYMEDPKRVDLLQGVVKETLKYYDRNKVETYDYKYHTHTVNDPSFTQWLKLYREALPALAKGEIKNIEEKFKEIDAYLEKAQPAKVKIGN